MRGSCHIRSVEIGVEYWNCCQILDLCFLLIFRWKKKTATKFCILWFVLLLYLIFFQLKIKKKTKIQNSKTISIFDANFNTSNMTWSAHLCAYPYCISVAKFLHTFQKNFYEPLATYAYFVCNRIEMKGE